MQPDYFARVSIYEAVHFAAGVRRRYRESWHQARYIAYMAAAPHCKDLRFEEMIKFKWEEPVKPVESEEEKAAALARLKAHAPIIQKILFKNGIESNS
jgi:hypothetical protein